MIALALAGCGGAAHPAPVPSNEAAAQPTTLCADGEPKCLGDLTLFDDQGKAHAMRDLAGKPVILAFLATWANPAEAQMKELVAFAQRGEGVPIFAIVTDAESAIATIWARTMGVNGFADSLFVVPVPPPPDPRLDPPTSIPDVRVYDERHLEVGRWVGLRTETELLDAVGL